MPFPLAHPAAVLPLRRYSTRYLNLAALMIGAITPDLSYCLMNFDLDIFAHSIRGCLFFSLPVGWLLVLVFYAVCEPLVKLLPTPHRQVLLPACRQPDRPWFAVPLSLLIGAATHVLWDSATHETGWFVERSSFLQQKLFDWNGHYFQMYRLLWHISSWVGLLLLYRAYETTLRTRAGLAKIPSAEEGGLYALWASVLLLPLVGAVLCAILYYAHRSTSYMSVSQFLHLSAALYLVELSVLLVAIAVALKIKRRPRHSGRRSPDRPKAASLV